MSLKSVIAILTAPDKILHGKGSVGVFLLTLAIMAVCYGAGLHPVTTMILIGGLLAAISVEGTQWHNNKKAVEAGNPPPHDVSILDALFSTLTPLIAAVAFEVVRWLHMLPSWPILQWDRLPVWMSI